MTDVTTTPNPVTELQLVKVARDLAMDIHPLETILKTHQITPIAWESLQNNTRFQRILGSEIEAWGSAANTAERVRLKSLSFVEEALPEFYARAHDPKEALSAKVEVLKTVARFAGVGVASAEAGFVGERFSVTINLGQGPDGTQVRIDKAVTAPVIEGEVL